ncbi:hypothetical protein [Acidithiobacillus caldus]|uniref:hypothetical protein n=1 Tax=Acidithiobacillus caldus TaxID=33059 RepID=UPI00114D1ADB|nr:hypothetical protein [Acidithiobacillus caldus]
MKGEINHIHAPQYGIRQGKRIGGAVVGTEISDKPTPTQGTAEPRPRFHYPKDLDIPGVNVPRPDETVATEQSDAKVPITVRKKRRAIPPSDR